MPRSSKNKTQKKNILFRSRLVFVLILIFSLSIVFKAAYIQIIEGPKWRRLAKNINIKHRPVKAVRGSIYSEDHSLLATSIPFYKVVMDPCIIDKSTFNNHIKDLSIKLAKCFKDKSPQDYESYIRCARKNKKRYIPLSRQKVNYNTRKKMLLWPLFNKGRYKGGVFFEKEERRYRPFKSLAARSVGHINSNGKGSGLEYTYDKYLRGRDGIALFQKTTGGWKKLGYSPELRPQDGYDIETTIDIHTQDIAENALKKSLVENDADYGCSLVIEVHTGEIKAIVNLSKIRDGVYIEDYNYAIGLQRDPGSTFKIVSMMALFEETNLKLTDTIDTGNGEYVFFDKTMRDVRRGGFGIITIQKVIEESSMIGVAKLVQNAFGHNPYRYIQYLDRMGFTSTLGFHILGEAQPIIKTPDQKNWSGVTLPWMSTGYEIEVTPLQILTFFNAIANNGKMIKPIIIKNIKNRNTQKTIKSFTTSVINRQICSIQTLKKIKTMLEGVVERGSARRIRKGIYKIAGKSGTAKIVEKGKYAKKYYVSFVGYFPIENPKYSCIVAVSNPKKFKQYGSNLAAPILRQIADKLAIYDRDAQKKQTNSFFESRKDIKVFPKIIGGQKRSLIYLCKNLNVGFDKKIPDGEYLRTKVINNKLIWVNNTMYTKQIPYVVGFTLKDATFTLERYGVKFHVIGSGNRIKKQSVAEGNPRYIIIETE